MNLISVNANMAAFADEVLLQKAPILHTHMAPKQKFFLIRYDTVQECRRLGHPSHPEA